MKHLQLLLLVVFASMSAIVALGCESTDNTGNTEPQSTVETAESTQPPTPTPAPSNKSTNLHKPPTRTAEPTALPAKDCAEPEDANLTSLLIELESCRPGISNDTRDVISLLQELEGFKTAPEFQQVGFGACCRFNTWLVEAKALQERAGIAPLDEVGIVPGHLILIGQEYVGSAGQPTEYTESLMSQIDFAVRKTMELERSDLSTPADMVFGKWIDRLPSFEARLMIFSDSTGTATYD